MALQTQSSGSGNRQPVTKFLVVCGASDVNDVWLFGDFLGFHHAFEALGAHGLYLNAFPATKYFDERPQYDSIKFGRVSATDPTPIDVYSRHNHMHRARFWTDFLGADQGCLLDRVNSTIETMATSLTAGDIFNVILIGHGSQLGINLAGRRLPSNMLANSLDHFLPGVRVNVIIKSCKSGTFVDSIRAKAHHERLTHTSSRATQLSYPDQRSPSDRFCNSVFSAAFLKSLGYGSEAATMDGWTLEGHIAMVAREGKTTLPPTNPDHWTNISVLNHFVDVIFADYIALPILQTRNAARRILNPTNPAQSEIASPPTTDIPNTTLHAADELVSAEIKLTYSDPPMAEDVRLIQAFHDTRNLKAMNRGRLTPYNRKLYVQQVLSIVEALRWRFRVQESFFVAVWTMVKQGVLDRERLCSGITWEEDSDQIESLVLVLQSYKIMQYCCHQDNGPIGFFAAPVYWLARVILRGCLSNLGGIFDYLKYTEILGPFDQAWSATIEGEVLTEYDMDQGGAVPPDTFPLPALGFWLPRSFQSDAKDQITRRYVRIKNLYEQCRGNDSWGDAVEIKEAMNGLL